MSLLRYAAPGRTVVLVDEGPQTHVARGSFGIRGNTEQGYMPFVRLPIVESAAEQARKARRRETRREAASRYREAQRCGVIMAFVGEPCARTAGHRDSHRSRAVLDADNRSKHGHSRAPWGDL